LILFYRGFNNRRNLVQRLHWRFGLARRSRIGRVNVHQSKLSPLTERSGTLHLSLDLHGDDADGSEYLELEGGVAWDDHELDVTWHGKA
jgi:hypothetical protein